MDNVVQSNAAASEESASSAEELSSQANELQRIIAELNSLAGGSDNLSFRTFEKNTGTSTITIPHSSSAAKRTGKPVQQEFTGVQSSELIPFDEDDDFGEF